MKLAVEENLVPAKDSTYVPFGFYTDLTRIVKSGMFYPFSFAVCPVTVKP